MRVSGLLAHVVLFQNVIFHDAFGVRVPGAAWLFDKELLLGAKQNGTFVVFT